MTEGHISRKNVSKKMTEGKTETLADPISTKEIKRTIENIPSLKNIRTREFLPMSSTSIQETSNSSIAKRLGNISKEGVYSTHFMRMHFLRVQPNQDYTRKESYWPVLLMNVGAKILKIIY